MFDVTLQASAIDQIMGDDDVRRWLKDRAGDRVPYLGYFRRCTSTYNDGSVVEHGVGFGLSTINPHDPKETSGIVIKPVTLTPQADILVGGGEEIMSISFSIGWSKWRFTYQPD